MFCLACVITVMLCACSSDEDENVIQPIDVTDSPVAAFFNAELRESRGAFFVDSIDSFGTAILKKESISCVVNSREELADLYMGNKELPEIDFDKYTLIIGQQIMPGLGYYIRKRKLVMEEDGLVLTLNARNDGEAIALALQHLYFWGLYPKLPQDRITVNVIEELPKFH